MPEEWWAAPPLTPEEASAEQLAWPLWQEMTVAGITATVQRSPMLCPEDGGVLVEMTLSRDAPARYVHLHGHVHSDGMGRLVARP